MKLKQKWLEQKSNTDLEDITNEEDDSEFRWMSNDVTYKLPIKFTSIHGQRNNVINNSDEKSVKIGHDLWKQLNRVPIPIFYGDKRLTKIGKLRSTPAVIQLLQHQNINYYCYAAIWQCIKSLGLEHSLFAYDAAKEKSERKYVGTTRGNEKKSPHVLG